MKKISCFVIFRMTTGYEQRRTHLQHRAGRGNFFAVSLRKTKSTSLLMRIPRLVQAGLTAAAVLIGGSTAQSASSPKPAPAAATPAPAPSGLEPFLTPENDSNLYTVSYDSSNPDQPGVYQVTARGANIREVVTGSQSGGLLNNFTANSTGPNHLHIEPAAADAEMGIVDPQGRSVALSDRPQENIVEVLKGAFGHSIPLKDPPSYHGYKAHAPNPSDVLARQIERTSRQGMDGCTAQNKAYADQHSEQHLPDPCSTSASPTSHKTGSPNKTSHPGKPTKYDVIDYRGYNPGGTRGQEETFYQGAPHHLVMPVAEAQQAITCVEGAVGKIPLGAQVYGGLTITQQTLGPGQATPDTTYSRQFSLVTALLQAKEGMQDTDRAKWDRINSCMGWTK